MRAVYETQWTDDAKLFADRALAVVARGYSAVKVLITPPTESLNSIAAYRYAGRTMEAIRLAVGEGIDIMVDCHGRHSLANAKHPFQQEVIHPMSVRAHDDAVLDW